MRAVVQRVSRASVSVDGGEIGCCDRGFLVLLGVMDGDGEAEAELLAAKTARLRVFEDDAGKMNLSLTDVGGGVLCVSQFTLCADVKKGNRPSFTPSAAPETADRLYRYYTERLRAEGIARVETGSFGADMQVSLVNDGPVTILLDTDVWKRAAK